MRPLAVATALATVLLTASPLAAPLRAQLRADPGRVIDGRVAVRVYVTLADDQTPYHPLANYTLRFRTMEGDSIVVRTDGSGTLTVGLQPGEYRLVSARPYRWHARRFSWNLPLIVRPDLGPVELNARNARVEAVPVSRPTAILPTPRGSGKAP
jgi:hypothetical protein